MIARRSEKDVAFLRVANQRVAQVLTALADMVRPGVTTDELNTVAEAMIRDAGDTPSFLGYHGYPKSVCVSVDAEVVHGIPGPRVLENNQIVSIDVGVLHEGWHGDAAVSVACGTVNEERARLMAVTNECLANAIKAAVSGNHLQDVSRAVQKTAEAAGFSVVRVFVGHGIGRAMHEEPQIPNFDTGNRGPKLESGMVLAIEPMINAGDPAVQVLEDGWTAVAADGKPSAHFEHSIVVRGDKAEILSLSSKRVWGV